MAVDSNPSVNVNKDIVFGDGETVTLSSKVIVTLNGVSLSNTNTGTQSVITILSGASGSQIIGTGTISGPSPSSTPVPATGYAVYPNHNGGIKVLGTYRDAVSDITIGEGIHVTGFDVAGIFMESTEDCQVWPRITQCGVDGIRLYGDERSNFTGARIENITPGFDGDPGALNAYGITASQRPQEVQLLSAPNDLTDGTYTKDDVTIVTASVSDPYTDDLDQVVETAATAAHQVRTDNTTDPTNMFFAAFFAQANGRDYVRLTLQDTGSSSNYVRIYVNLSDGSVIGTHANSSAVLHDYGVDLVETGKYRIWVIATPGVSTGNTRLIAQVLDSGGYSMTSGGSYAGDITKGIRVGGMQLADIPTAYFMEFGDYQTVNRQSAGSKIGCYVHDVPTWAGLDTHGGANIDFSGGYITRCRVPYNLDAQESAGNTPHTGCIIKNFFCDAQDLDNTNEETFAGVVVVGPVSGDAVSSGTIVDDGTIIGYGGPVTYTGGIPSLGRAGVYFSNILDFKMGGGVSIIGPRRAGVACAGICSGVIESFYVEDISADTGVQEAINIQSRSGDFPDGVFAKPSRIIGTVLKKFSVVDGSVVESGEYTVSTLDAATLFTGRTVFVSDETGGAVVAYSDGTNWRRVTDRAIVS